MAVTPDRILASLRTSFQEGGTGSLGGATRTPVITSPQMYMVRVSQGGVDTYYEVMQTSSGGVQLGRPIPLPMVQKRLLQGTGTVIPLAKFQAAVGVEGPPAPVGPTMPTTPTGGSVSSGQSQEQTFAPLTPPVLEILTELRARRQAVRDAALANFGATLQAAPVMAGNLEYFPGLEPGGLADIWMGRISGKGTEAAKALTPTSMRQPMRVPLPPLASPMEPTLGSEFGGALSLAAQIINAVLPFLTGQASATSSGSSSGGGAEPTAAETSQAQLNAYLAQVGLGAQ